MSGVVLAASLNFGASEGLPARVTATMWAIAALVAVMMVVVAVLYLIFRDAMEDDANWVHGVGAIVLWIVLALCVEGCQSLAESLPRKGEVSGRVFVDAWISIGLRTVIYLTTPFLVLLGMTVGKTLWDQRQDRKSYEKDRLLRGTLMRVKGKRHRR